MWTFWPYHLLRSFGPHVSGDIPELAHPTVPEARLWGSCHTRSSQPPYAGTRSSQWATRPTSTEANACIEVTTRSESSSRDGSSTTLYPTRHERRTGHEVLPLDPEVVRGRHHFDCAIPNPSVAGEHPLRRDEVPHARLAEPQPLGTMQTSQPPIRPGHLPRRRLKARRGRNRLRSAGCALTLAVAVLAAGCLHAEDELVRPTTPRGDWQDLRIPAYGALAGDVRSKRGQPVGGARILSEPLDDSGFVYPVGIRTSADGRFVDTAVAAPGKYEVTASADGYRQATKTVLVERRRLTVVHFELERDGGST
jgi:hypothetical protein